MSERRVIDCEELWARQCRTPDGLRAVREWLRVNGIDPNDVPIRSELVIEDSAFGMVIRYEAYLRTAEGRPFVDPVDPDRAAVGGRTVLLQLAPPADWLTATGGER
ncbi:hypothetical protein ACFVP3_23415 [Streptomyces sp. NPDC057806]|uniref:hypothetical protein n=1 Tax=Streptomyces sp. NPDC057806 TaxID=3346255 RepID=UPI003695E865